MSEVTIGILAALPVEGAAMACLIEDLRPFEDTEDPNTYRIGQLPSSDPARPHRVALAVLPRDGTRYAAMMCTNLLRTFPGVRCVIMMGIAGGIPRPNDPAKHVRLGDVVVATAGIVDYGHVRQTDGKRSLRRSDGQISNRLLRAVRELQFSEAGGLRPWERWLNPERNPHAREYRRPDEGTDRLYIRGALVSHPDRLASGHPPNGPKIHYGAVASSDVLMRDELARDELAEEFDNLVAMEMEGSGIAASTAGHDVPWFMVRGISDYCENHAKNDAWQRHASYATAAYVRALLEVCRPIVTGGVGREPALLQAQSKSHPVTLAIGGGAVREASRESSILSQSPPPHWLADCMMTESEMHIESDMSTTSLLAADDAQSRVAIWGGVPPRIDFIGRMDLLDKLQRRLSRVRVTAIIPRYAHRMGGIGKSRIAAEYAHLHRDDYDIIWWISAERPEQIQHALVDLGERLCLDAGVEASVAVPAVLEALRMGVPSREWLLIFDNAESLEPVQKFFPGGGAGRILVTSRDTQWASVDAEPLEIDVFAREESIELLLKRNPDMRTEYASRIADALGDLPLAVAHASAWLATTRMPALEYLQLLAEKHVELAGEATPPGYQVSAAVAWNVALDRLGIEDPGALQLLQVCSYFAAEPIGREFFTGLRNAPIAPELDATLQDPSELSRTVRDIQRYGLAQIDHLKASIHLHRLVRTVLAARLSPGERSRMRHGAHVLLAGGNPSHPDRTAQWSRYHALLPHLQASGAVSCRDPWVRQLVLDAIEFLYYWGGHTACRDLARRAVHAWRETFGADDRQTLQAAKWLGFVLRILGAFDEAAKINEDCLQRFQRVAAPDDEGLLDAMSLVAADRRAAGSYRSACELDRAALEACRQEFGPDDPITQTAAHSLGVSLRLAGDFQFALELDRDTCWRRVSILGEDHALTLWTLNGFILDRRECGAYLQAHAEHERLYVRFQRVWGKDHLNTFTVARSLAVSRRRAGRRELALELARDTTNRLRNRFGAMHPEAIAASLSYSIDLRENGEVDASRTLAERVCRDYETVFGAQHPYTLHARVNLAVVLRLLGNVNEAYVYDLQAFEILLHRLGPDHPLTLASATSLANDRAAQGDYNAALQLGYDTLTRIRERFGVRHPSTLSCALNLSLDLIALGQSEEAVRMRAEMLTAFSRVLGEQHPAVIAAKAGVRANWDLDPMPL